MFNEIQQKIASHTEGPVLVIAGPGSGKTKTLIDRVVNLVNKGVAPEAIIVGTFCLCRDYRCYLDGFGLGSYFQIL